ncbi:PAS domain S-box protein [Methylococcus sp. EFPC2]|uniref:PAS domain-containing hybrid sensor histidine kinase/response regulator n=1 Tax=Methylococcus sp. EFPC2 TaxID=2812648 RepID=UPI001967E49E|nr:PAS domain S-box protein [Methylococcus sp. EFPC2]QSA98904.1 PAS domain S-box protein [Methylococcus sp. EFPC2]
MRIFTNPTLIPLALFVVGLVIAGTEAFRLHADNAALAQTRFDVLADRVAGQLTARLQTYEYGLRGTRGAVIGAGGTTITRQRFRLYSDSRELAREFPGARGYGFIRRVAPEQKDDFVSSARDDGAPGFAIQQLEPHAGDLFVIQYIEPEDANRESIGLDIASESTRRDAAISAMLSGKPTLTGSVTLVQAPGRANRGFLLLLPVYRLGETPVTPGQRMAATLGWVYAPLVIDEILADFDFHEQEFTLALTDVTDSEAPESFFRSPGNERAEVDGLVKRIPIAVFGRQWQVEVKALPVFLTRLNLFSPAAATSFIALLAALLALLLYVYLRSIRRRLHASIARSQLAAIVDSTIDAIIGKSLDGRVTSWNKGAEALFGYTEQEAVGRLLTDLIVPPDRLAEEAELLAHIAQGECVAHFTSVRRHRDGRLIDVSVAVAPIVRSDGRVVGAAKTVRDITDSKRAEERFRRVFEAAPNALLMVDRMRRITLVNRGIEEMFGYTREELVGETVEILVPANFRNHHPAQVDSYFRSPKARAMGAGRELYGVRKDGTEVPIEIGLNPVDMLDDLYTLASIIDITARKQAQERILALNATLEQQVVERTAQLQAYAALQHAILANAGNAVIATDTRGTITVFNPAAEAMLGYRADDVIDRTTPEIFHDRQEVAGKAAALTRALGRPIPPGFEVFAAAARQEGGNVSEWTYIRKDGRRLPVLLTVSTLREDGGPIMGYLGIAVDLTERKRSESLLAEQEALQRKNAERLQLATEAAGVGVWEYDLTTGQLSWDDSMIAIYGKDRATLANAYATWRDSVLPEDRPAAEAALQDSIERGRPFDTRFRIRRGDGEVRVIRALARVHHDESGRATRMVGTNEDISADVAAQEALRDGTQQLEKANAELMDARAQAEHMAQVKSDFLANMSHEIRTPMNAILGLAYLLGKSELSPPVRDMVQKIHHAGRSLLGLINDILDFSKIEAQRLKIEEVPFGLGEVLDNVATIMSSAVGAKGIEVVVGSAPAGCDALKGDPLRLGQVLINLTSNAIKFTEQGEVVVAITRVDNGGDRVRLSFAVRDTGIGIPLDKQKEIFSPFAQGDTSTTRRFGGTGLGLAISRRLVELMGGELRVASTPGVGSEFSFEISFEKIDANGCATPSMALQRVLIADDHALARNMLTERANSLGWNAEAVDSGRAAIASVEDSRTSDKPFDVLLLDWRMPEVDGLAAAASIRDMLGDEQRPIIVMVTAHDREQLMAQPGSELVDVILTKPVTSSCLYNAVLEAKSRRGDLGQAVETAAVQRLAGLHVLVVDDSEINREVACRILEGEGAKVELAVDGRDALTQLSADPQGFDIVLMDVQMPVMDGYEATREIRQTPALAQLPVVALTAGAFRNQHDAALASGMDGFIAKPFVVEDLVALLRNLTRGSHDRPSAPSAPPAEPASDAALLPLMAVDQGLNLWGDAAVYRKYLRTFAHSHCGDGHAIAEALKNSERDAAAAIAHKLRGAAGSLALSRAAGMAGAIEQTLREGGEASSLAEALHLALDETRRAIAEYAAEDSAQPAIAPANADSRELLGRFLSLLDRDDPGEVEPLLSELAVVLSAGQVGQLRELIDAFDFRGAEALTRTLLAALDSPRDTESGLTAR